MTPTASPTSTAIVIVPNSVKLQIVHAPNPIQDQLNTGFTFIEYPSPTCTAEDSPFNFLSVMINTGSCANVGKTGLPVDLESFTVDTINHTTYGTKSFVQPPIEFAARLVQLTPPALACGEWSLTLEYTGVDLGPLGSGPFALILANKDGGQGCIDVTNAIVN
jgi:hypothetical protein